MNRNPPTTLGLVGMPQTHGRPPIEPTAKLSRMLLNLAERFQDHPLRFGEVVEATQGRGFNLRLIILVLPFRTRISLPLSFSA